MTPEGILTSQDLQLDSNLGARVVRMLHAKEVVSLHRARERQLRIAAKQEERRRFGNGATVTMSLDPVLFMRIAKDPRFTTNAFGEKEFEKDMRKWHPEFIVKTRHTTKSFALGGISEGRGQKSEARGQRAEARSQRTEGRSQRPEARGQKPEGRGQKSEARGQKSEARGQKPEARGRYDKDAKYLIGPTDHP